MAKMGVGISFDRKLIKNSDFGKIINIFLKTLFNNDDISYKTAYLYDQSIGKTYKVNSVEEGLDILYKKKIYNRFDFFVNNHICYIQLDILKDEIHLGLTVQYDFLNSELSDDKEDSMVENLQNNLVKFHEIINYKYAFSDFDIEFDFSYEELEELAEKNESPYLILVIDINNKKQVLNSEYHMFGIC